MGKKTNWGIIDMSTLRDQIDAGKWAMVEARDVPSVLALLRHMEISHSWCGNPLRGRRQRIRAQFGAAVESLAGALHSRGVQIGDRILVHLDNYPNLSAPGLRARLRHVSTIRARCSHGVFR